MDHLIIFNVGGSGVESPWVTTQIKEGGGMLQSFFILWRDYFPD
jgi:hypothetical protein